MGVRGSDRGVTPVVANVLLVAIAVVLGVVIITLSFSFVDDTGTPTAEATFEFEENPVGLELVPTALGQPVTVQLNGRDVATLDAGDVGMGTLLPTAPGDEVTVVSADGERSLLLREEVDDRSEIGDFVLYYDFTAGSGSTVVDRSRNDNEGTLLDDDGGSGPTWTDGCLAFDGENDHVETANISVGGVSAVDSFTVATEVTIDAETGSGNQYRQQFVEHRFGGNEWFLETSDSDAPFSALYAVEYPARTVEASDALSTGESYVVVGTYDGESNEYALYIDGTEVANGAYDRAVGMGELHLARDFESQIQYLDGEMCEFRLYYTAFSEDEVASLTETMRDEG